MIKFFVFEHFLHIIYETKRLQLLWEEMRQLDDNKRWYGVDELSEMLQISRQAVYGLLRRGELHAVKAGGKYFISRKSFDYWLDGPKSVNEDGV